jgi:hypothetical protein
MHHTKLHISGVTKSLLASDIYRIKYRQTDEWALSVVWLIFVCVSVSVARSSGFARKIPDFGSFSGFFPASGFFLDFQRKIPEFSGF